MRLQRTKAHVSLVLAVIAVALLPMIGAFLRWGHPPPGFAEAYPANHSGISRPEMNWFVWGAGVFLGGVILAFIFFPSLFRFRERGTRRRLSTASGGLPWWFFAGAVVMLASWYMHWFGTDDIVLYSFLPLWWGYIFTVDGIVFARTGGRSMVATELERLIVIAVLSIPAWGFFEILNYYALELWYYPRDQFFPPLKQALWHLASFSVVLPAIFEWYTLLHTFDGLWNRWRQGPPVQIARSHLAAVIVIGALSLIAFGALPIQFFVLVWIGPPIVLIAALAALRFWTPFRPIARGNWSPAVLVGLASLANGFFWELWNYGSERWRVEGQGLNPNYWKYDIPYVNWPPIWSEMPLLGYFGYLPFGGLAWACWLVAAHILDLEPSFELTSPPEDLATSPVAAATSP